jgi:hypothetical protein
MIFSSVNLFAFIVRSWMGGLYLVTVLFAGGISQALQKDPNARHFHPSAALDGTIALTLLFQVVLNKNGVTARLQALLLRPANV